MKKILLHNKWKVLVYTVSSIFTTAFNIGFIAILQQLVDQAASGETENIKELILWGCVFCVGFALIAYFKEITGKLYKNRCIYLLRKTYVHNLLKQKYSDITHLDSSTHISTLTNDIEIMSQNYFDPILYMFDNITLVIGSFVAMLFISPVVTALMCGLTVLMAIVPGLLKKIMDTATFHYSEALKTFTGKLKEILLGVEVVKSSNAESHFEQAAADKNMEIQKKQNRLVRIVSTIGISSSFINNILIMSLVGVTAYFVSGEKLMIGTTMAVLNLSMRFLGSVQGFVSQVVMTGSTSQIRATMKPYLTEVKEKPSKEIIPFEHQIVLSDVSFQYNESTEKKILHDFSIQFEAGKKYLILGKSGSGKSTLLKLLSKLEDSYQGSIQLDNKDYRDLSEANINQIVSLAQQDCYLFKASLRDNIDLLQTRNERQMDYAIKGALLTDFVDALPNGIETLVDEEVNQVSGGEKLRINLARALYRDSKILLLDEITSSVDKNTARQIEQMILNITGKTILNVCHKFDTSTLPYYDEIIIIEQGSIAARGPYEELKSHSLLMSYQGKKENAMVNTQ